MSSCYPDGLFWLTGGNVLCVLLFLFIISFHWSWLWSSSFPLWIYHFIILTSFCHFETTFISQFAVLHSRDFSFSLHSFAGCFATYFYCFTSLSGRVLFWVPSLILSQDLIMQLLTDGVSDFYWKQSIWPVAYLIQKENKVSHEWMDTWHDTSRCVLTCGHLRLNGRWICQTNEPPNISADKI